MQVVTAAFCAFSNRNTSLRVAINRNTGSLAYEITDIVYHPLFNANTKANDLALLQMNSPIRIEDDVQLAELDDDVLRGGVVLTLAAENDAVTVTNADCRSRVGPLFAPLVRDEHICTVSASAPPTLDGRGVVRNGGRLAAVPSWILGNVYVHSRITGYNDWIVSVIED